MRSCMCWREKRIRTFLSQSGFFFCFLIGGYIYKYEGYFDPFNQLTWGFLKVFIYICKSGQIWGVFKSVYIYLKTIENTKNSPSALHGI